MRGFVVLLAALALTASAAESQRRGFYDRELAAALDDEGYWELPSSRFKGNQRYDGRFTFARIKYRGMRCFSQQGPGWAHDYPDAEGHLVQIMKELTSMRPNLGGGNVLTLKDTALFRHPVAYLSEPGCWNMTDEEAAGLRAYLLKGGFLIFDDFGDWGRRELMNTELQLRRAIPGAKLVQLDATHPIFDSFFHIKSLSIIESTYRGIPEYWALFENNDPRKRMLAILNVNNDIGENWEFSHTGFIPISITNESYKLGVNYLVYAMTH